MQKNKYIRSFEHINLNIYSTKNTINNISDLKKRLGIFKFYSAEQTHSNNIKIIKKNIFDYKDCDGLITFFKLDFPIIIRTADCVPLFFWHDTLAVYGIIHAGRAGTNEGITTNLCNILIKNNIDISKMNFLFGPYICHNCYEIDKKNKIFFDLYEQNIKQLKHNKIDDCKINSMQICTLENHDFFSYRRDKTEKRIFNIIDFKNLNSHGIKKNQSVLL